MKSRIYIGIDQTGAVDRKGKPHPLPACALIGDKVALFYIESFTRRHIESTLKLDNKQSISICIDCVIGLPQELNITWRQALELIKGSEGFGRVPAQKFFSKISQGKIHHRQVEIECKANSVFREKPFQKNIQTGTYRLWKDIASCEDEFYVPHLGETRRKKALPIYEGYPSLSWKLLFDVKSRLPEKLPSLIRKKFPNIQLDSKNLRLLRQDPNLADAFVLALTMKTCHGKPASRGPKNEGWILGHS